MTRAMKDSGIEWIGQIPEDWEIAKLKYCAKIYTGNSISDNEKDDYTQRENSIPYISTKDIDADTQKIEYDNDLFIPVNNENFKVAPKNSVLLCIEGGSAGKKIAFTNRDVCFVNKLCCFCAKESCASRYIYYSLQSSSFLTDFNLCMSGLIGGVSTKQLKNIMLSRPSFVKQQKIANYLDKKCGKIDDVIDNQKQIIEKLKEYKQSLITETVTKGLNPNVKMKDSGIEWIGQIPEDWDVLKMSRIFRERKCKNVGMQENNVLSLSYGNIKRRNIENNMGLIPESFETYNIIVSGNIVLRLTDLQNDHKSLRCGLVKEQGIITSAYVTLENIIDVDTNYYYRLLHTFDVMKGFYNMGDGVRQSLKFGELSKLLFPKPPIDEQKEIAEYLDSKCAEIDKAINQKEETITKLEEYKKSLIFECVTGKREIV